MVDARTPNSRVDRAVVDRPLDLNTASVEELREIDGIGEGRAARIVEWRERNRRFEAVDELQRVPGFSLEDVARVRDRLTV